MVLRARLPAARRSPCRRAVRARQPGDSRGRGAPAGAGARDAGGLGRVAGAARRDRRLPQGPFRLAPRDDPGAPRPDQTHARLRRHGGDRRARRANVLSRRRPRAAERRARGARRAGRRDGRHAGQDAGRIADARDPLPRRVAAELRHNLQRRPAGLGPEQRPPHRIRRVPRRTRAARDQDHRSQAAARSLAQGGEGLLHVRLALDGDRRDCGVRRHCRRRRTRGLDHRSGQRTRAGHPPQGARRRARGRRGKGLERAEPGAEPFGRTARGRAVAGADARPCAGFGQAGTDSDGDRRFLHHRPFHDHARSACGAGDLDQPPAMRLRLEMDRRVSTRTRSGGCRPSAF